MASVQESPLGGSSSAVLAELLQRNTETAIGAIQARIDAPTVVEQLEDVQAQIEDAAQIKNKQRRDTQIQILTAKLSDLRKLAATEEADLANAVLGLNKMIEDMGGDYTDLAQPNADELKLISDAQAVLTDLEKEKTRVTDARMIWDRAGKLTAVEEKMTEARTGIENAKTESRRKARGRLMSADMESSLQTFQLRVEQTRQIMERRLVQIVEQLTIVAARKGEAFRIKTEAAAALETLEGMLNTKEGELSQEEELLSSLANGTQERAAQDKKVSDLRMEVEDVRGRRNVALALFQSKEKFAAELEIHEKAQMKMRDNQRIWITCLKSDTEERVVTFKSRLEAMKTSSDQEVARALDEMGAAVDLNNAQYMATAAAASDRHMIEKIEEHPDRMHAMLGVSAAQAEAHQKVRLRFAEQLRLFKQQYGADPLESSFFHYNGSEGEGESAKG